MPTIALAQIDVGGPCKVSDGGQVIYFEDGVKIVPEAKYREIPSDVGGEQDGTLVDLVWKMSGKPKSVWTAGYRGVLLPDTLLNWTTSGGRVCGAANRSVSVIGSDSHGFTFTRMCLTKPPNVYGGLGKSLYDEAEWTGFIGNGKSLVDSDAFMTENTTAWSQADYPTTHQEQMCTGAWSAKTGWDTVFAEDGFKLSHELGLADVKQGSITVDKRVTKYRAMWSFMPQQPTTTQLLAGLGLQGAGLGIGSRLSAGAADFMVAGTGLSITGKNMGLNRGAFAFDNKLNRPGEFGMITSLTVPGTRLVFA